MSRFVLGKLCGIAVLVISSIALLSYLFDMPRLRAWTGDVGMAVGTAVCFVLTSLALALIAPDDERKG